MRGLPLSIGAMHFIGIGGIGMSGIAEILHNLGYTVQGSDHADSANVQRLRDLGVRVTVGHQASNIRGAQVVVTSAAVADSNPELKAARAQLIPVVRRAHMLAELMRLKWSIAVGGTHGKTTTTSMVAKLLDTAGLDPTVVNGGIINAYGTNARLGSGDWLVAEADESDGSFVKLPALIGVVTNIDPEHLDFYESFDAERRAFESFVENIPFYGFAAMCLDDPEVQAMIPQVADRRIVTYGFAAQADVRAENIAESPAGARFDLAIDDRYTGERRRIPDLTLPMPGRHNVTNALAALAIGHEMRLSDDVLAEALRSFTGVKRRFTRTGTVGGVTVIDDYAHHPVEITATLAAARSTGPRHIIAVIQPHRYTRLSHLFADFCTSLAEAEHVVIAPVYSAGETPIEGASRDDLAAGLHRHGHRHVHTIDGPGELAPLMARLAGDGDMILCLGAGSITHWAAALPEELAAAAGDRAEAG